jgi:hypothetical protein
MEMGGGAIKRQSSSQGAGCTQIRTAPSHDFAETFHSRDTEEKLDRVCKHSVYYHKNSAKSLACAFINVAVQS